MHVTISSARSRNLEARHRSTSEELLYTASAKRRRSASPYRLGAALRSLGFEACAAEARLTRRPETPPCRRRMAQAAARQMGQPATPPPTRRGTEDGVAAWRDERPRDAWIKPNALKTVKAGIFFAPVGKTGLFTTENAPRSAPGRAVSLSSGPFACGPGDGEQCESTTRHQRSTSGFGGSCSKTGPRQIRFRRAVAGVLVGRCRAPDGSARPRRWRRGAGHAGFHP